MSFEKVIRLDVSGLDLGWVWFRDNTGIMSHLSTKALYIYETCRFELRLLLWRRIKRLFLWRRI